MQHYGQPSIPTIWEPAFAQTSNPNSSKKIAFWHSFGTAPPESIRSPQEILAIESDPSAYT
jgi:hypothetical protein